MASALRPTVYSRSIEDYLKAILELAGPGSAAQTTAIADSLSVAPASVSGMVKKLAEAGLIEHEPYRGVVLTESGKLAALRIVRRHRILESYLTSRLGYDWDTVHDEAERLEHAVSDELIDRMAAALGNPRYDPHGAPIPTTGGDIEELNHVTLAEIPIGATAELRMVSDKDPDRLRYLATLGLKPGVIFEVLSREPFRGPVAIRLSGDNPRDQVLGHELAETLLCSVAGRETER